MVLKFLAVGLITAALAGGAVYLGVEHVGVDPLTRSSVDVAQPAPSNAAPLGSETRHAIIDRRLRGATPEDATPDTREDDRPVAESPLPATAPNALTPSDATPLDTTLSDVIPARTDFARLLSESQKLRIPDARDDAYLNILTLALAQSRYDVTDDVVAQLSSPELRDTARQRIGISHARAGRLNEAFAVLDDLDVSALEDPIRLEIIRAVARGDRLTTAQPGQPTER